jgi:Mor family transcriptional regulator
LSPARPPDDAPVASLDLRRRTRQVLSYSEYRTAGDLRAASDSEVLRHPNLGVRMLLEIRAVLDGREPVRPWRQQQAGSKAERNAAIVAEVLGGARQKDVAAKYGITASVVWQIMRRHKRDSRP